MACLHGRGRLGLEIQHDPLTTLTTITTCGWQRFNHVFYHRRLVPCLHNDPPAHANNGLPFSFPLNYRAIITMWSKLKDYKPSTSSLFNMGSLVGMVTSFAICRPPSHWKNDAQEAVKKQFNMISHSNSGSKCLLLCTITC